MHSVSALPGGVRDRDQTRNGLVAGLKIQGYYRQQGEMRLNSGLSELAARYVA